MDRHRSLRVTLLAALGAVGCSSQKASPEPTLVTIPTPPTPASDLAPVASDPPPAHRKVPGKGWITETNGMVHRGSRVSCDATIQQTACKGTENRTFCKSDDDCKEHPHGKCVSDMGQIGTFCGCQYACENDDECGEGLACVCKGTGSLRNDHSVCAKAHCSVDADCPDGTCDLSAYNNGCYEEVSLVCHPKSAECQSDSDCKDKEQWGNQCVAVGDPRDDSSKPRWKCAGMGCVIGRPLIIENEARAASLALRDDWCTSADFEPEALSPEHRALLAEHYAAMAALEHASVASFARFSLQLLALGAPPLLVAETHKAALDEIEHARMAYGTASRLAGRELGPGPLPEAALPLTTSVSEIVEALVEEGCVGETLGAGEGRELARLCRDPALATALAHIASDEESHAALAWRSLKWLLHTFGDEAKRAADRAFARAMERYLRDPEEGPVSDEAWGVLSAPALGALRRELLAQVIAPCRAAMDSHA